MSCINNTNRNHVFDTGTKGNTIEQNKYTISKYNKNQPVTPTVKRDTPYASRKT